MDVKAGVACLRHCFPDQVDDPIAGPLAIDKAQADGNDFLVADTKVIGIVDGP